MFFFPTMKVNANRHLVGYQHSSKYLFLCSAEETNSYSTGLEQHEGVWQNIYWNFYEFLCTGYTYIWIHL